MRAILNLNDLADEQAHRAVFTRLMRHLAATAPYRPLSREGRLHLINLRDDLLAGRILHCNESLWHTLLANGRGDDLRSRQDLRCGAGILDFAGLLGEVLERYGPARVPLHLALIALALCEYEPGCLDEIADRRGCYRLWVTSYGGAALGVHGDLLIGKHVPIHTGPRDLLERHFAGRSQLAHV